MPNLQSVEYIDWEQILSRDFTPSPESWSDQVIYYLMIDRFSDGGEVERELYTPAVRSSAVSDEESARRWRASGATYCGGTLSGVISKLDYLKNLGITTIWLSPVLQQPRYDLRSYHGYGAQNFLQVDPHFGTLEDLQLLVNQAHQRDMYVLLDIVLNHAGNVFQYDVPINSESEPLFKLDGAWPVKGWYNRDGEPTVSCEANVSVDYPAQWPDGVIWPRELQNLECFCRRGCIQNWEDPDQYLHGDFKLLKTFNLGEVDGAGVFQASQALQVLTRVYQYWLAVADLDGFRIDAVKHMGVEATQFFTSKIRQFASSIGKHQLLLAGEIPGEPNQARLSLQNMGLDAALALLDYPDEVEKLATGKGNPTWFFQYFASDRFNDTTEEESIETSSHFNQKWPMRNLVTMYDDHDQIRKNFDKARLCSHLEDKELAFRRAFTAIGLLLTTCGIPCLYYGSEQALDGYGDEDIYIRESMFGGEFGAFRTRNLHCFNTNHWLYRDIARLLELRRQYVALRRGNQRLLRISGDNKIYGYPEPIDDKLLSIIPWVREYGRDRILCVYNSADLADTTAWVDLIINDQEIRLSELIFQSGSIDYSIQHQKLCLTLSHQGWAIFLLQE